MDNEIEKNIEVEKWALARKHILYELKKEPDSHWLLTRLSLTYYEERNYKKALEISERSLKIAPQCPLVMWDYAGVLCQLGKEAEAIVVWKSLVKRGYKNINLDSCNEGVRWSKSLVIDCNFRISKAYKQLNKNALAIKYMKKHLAERTSGTRSIYPIGMVRQELSKLLNAG